ncbi:uncharacterized protein C8A04DRAFT_38107 [Dichotomopilus funicola]|uniref:Uncharacterized protein n=1 Tax=Dichotomopilus funicola TaxID=1934379 RepID=A0AAN6ZLX8_9PEZI|nr:hypothetical protein C8A04DRAFT_38107 [Dichotomopilus funicola]
MNFLKGSRLTVRIGPRATRCFSATAIRPLATPTGRYPPNDTRNTNDPVDDIDLVFDYPSENQTSHQKERLETSGLDYRSAMPHPPKPSLGQQTPGTGQMGEGIGATDSNVKYIGLGAIGLGGLYMMMRRPPQKKSSQAQGSNMTQPGDIAAQKPAGSEVEKMLGRGR